MSTRSASRARPLLAWLLAALLLAAQGLGLAHRIAHVPGLAQGALPGAAASHEEHQAQVPQAWVDGHEAGTAECRLVDQLAHADGLCDGAWVDAGAWVPQDAPAALPATALRAAPAPLYQARAPPRR